MLAALAKAFVLLCIAFAWCGCRPSCAARRAPSHMRSLTPEQLEEVLSMSNQANKSDARAEHLQQIQAVLQYAARELARLSRMGPCVETAHGFAMLCTGLAARMDRGKCELPVHADDTHGLLQACAKALDAHKRPSAFRTIEVNEVQITQGGVAEALSQLAWEIETGRDAWART